jgi:predicted lipid-binding transport protein (Tim44 family)/uncharacterized tellurite resistance protein B-like protein
MLIMGVVVAYAVIEKMVKNAQGDSSPHQDVQILRTGARVQSTQRWAAAEQTLKTRDPTWNRQTFLARIGKAFVQTQEGWSRQDLAKVQAYVSDGIYERFSLQIQEMKQDNLRDHMEQIRVVQSEIVQMESDAVFDTVHVLIRASVVNYRVHLKTNAWVEGSKSPETFGEIWSFFRRPGAKTLAKPGLIEGFCPNCAAPIEIGRAAVCGSCSSYLRSGEHDWVLAEITQECEWVVTDGKSIPGLDRMRKADPGFHLQHIEDRLSVVFWRTLVADRLGNPDPVRKFALPAFVDEMAARYACNDKGIRSIFTGCAVGSVEVVGVYAVESLDRLFVEVRWSGRLSDIDQQGKIIKRASAPKNIHNIFCFQRRHGVITEWKNTLMSSHCPNCGAAESGSELICSYCNHAYNDGAKEWVLEKYIAPHDAEFREYLKQIKLLDGTFREELPIKIPVAARPAASAPTRAILLRSPADGIRWLATVMLADGVIDDKEMASLRGFAERCRVPTAKLMEIVEAAKVQTALPAFNMSKEEVREVLKMMIAMGLADGAVGEAEMAIIRTAGQKVGYAEADLSLLIAFEKNRLLTEAKKALGQPPSA